MIRPIQNRFSAVKKDFMALMADDLIYIPIDDKQNYSFCKLQQ